MLIAALFTIAKMWNQPRCLSTGEWIGMLWYVYTIECYSAIKRNAFVVLFLTYFTLYNKLQVHLPD